MIEGDRWYRARLDKGHELRMLRGHRLPILEPWEYEVLDAAVQLPDPTDVVEEVTDTLERYAARMAVQALPERERQIIEFSFGFCGEPRTLGEIGAELGITTERVRQLRSQALVLLGTLLGKPEERTPLGPFSRSAPGGMRERERVPEPRQLGLLCTRSSCWTSAVCRLTHVDAAGNDIWRVAACDRCATVGMNVVTITEGSLVRKPLNAGKLHLPETPPSLLAWAKS